MTYAPPLEVIAWHKERQIFMTCFVAGTETHPANSRYFKYEGGEYVRRSTRLYWVDRTVELEDILGERHYFKASV